MRAGVLAVALAAILAAVAAAPASAVTTVSNPGGGNALVVTAAPGVANNGLSVSYLPAFDTYAFKENFGSDLMAAPAGDARCTVTLQPNAGCTPTAGITHIIFNVGDNDDRVFVQRAPQFDLQPIPATVTMIADLGPGNDEITSGIGNDQIVGGPGADNLLGSEGDDTIAGQEGRDTIIGGPGVDSMFGGHGNDQLFARDHTRDARIHCGRGRHDDAPLIDRRSPRDPRPRSCEEA